MPSSDRADLNKCATVAFLQLSRGAAAIQLHLINERVLTLTEPRLTLIVSFAYKENNIGLFGRELKAADAC